MTQDTFLTNGPMVPNNRENLIRAHVPGRYPVHLSYEFTKFKKASEEVKLIDLDVCTING